MCMGRMGHKCLLIDVLSPLVSQSHWDGEETPMTSRIFQRVATNIGNAVADMSRHTFC